MDLSYIIFFFFSLDGQYEGAENAGPMEISQSSSEQR